MSLDIKVKVLAYLNWIATVTINDQGKPVGTFSYSSEEFRHDLNNHLGLLRGKPLPYGNEY